MSKKGIFISIEGCEGAGKSTALKYIKNYLEKKKIDLVTTREPGGTEIAEHVRSVLLAHHEEAMHAETEMLLMFASRVQHVKEKIKPALEAGKWVVSDRFVDASYAYQGGGRQLGVDKIIQLKEWLFGDFYPDLTILMDITPEEADKRLQRRHELDRIELEGREFFKRVRDTYLVLAKEFPERFFVINSSRTISQVQGDIAKRLDEVIANHA